MHTLRSPCSLFITKLFSIEHVLLKTYNCFVDYLLHFISYCIRKEKKIPLVQIKISRTEILHWHIPQTLLPVIIFTVIFLQSAVFINMKPITLETG